jgi:thioredoxin 1
MDPVVDDMLTIFDGRLKMIKLDLDANSHLARDFGINSAPAFLFFKDGELVDQIIGAVPRKEFSDKLVVLLGPH